MRKFFEKCFVWALYVFFAICGIVSLVCTLVIMPLVILIRACFYILTSPIELFKMLKRSWQK